MMENETNEFGYYISEFDIKPDFDKDKAIFQIGLRHLYNKSKMFTGLSPELKKKYNDILNDPENYKEDVMEVGREQYASCVSEEQLIPEKYWADVQTFTPPKLSFLYHPHFRLLFDLVKNVYKMNSDTLVVCSCGGAKPYINNKKYNMLLKASKAGYFDLVVCSVYPVFLHPLDTSRMYPNSFYEWPHIESPQLRSDLQNNKIHYLVEFLNLFHYKKIILVHNGKHTYFYQKIKEICSNWDHIESIDIFPDNEDEEKLKEKFQS